MTIRDLISFSTPNLHNSETYVPQKTIGSSDCNDYIPVVSLFINTLLQFDNLEIPILEYGLLKNVNNDYFPIRTYSSVLSELKRNIFPVQFNFKIQGNNHYLFISKGIIYDKEENVLMCLAIKSDYAINNFNSFANYNSFFIDPDKFVLYVSDKLNDPIYKTFKKKLSIEYIENIRQLGIDIIETKKIKERLFRNNFRLPKFKSIIDMNKYLKEEVPKILLID